MKKIWTLLTGALLSVCLWLGMGQGMSLEARAQDVTLERGEQVAYEGYVTNYYYIDGELGYCLEPEKMPPEEELTRRTFWAMISLLAKLSIMCTAARAMRIIWRRSCRKTGVESRRLTASPTVCCPISTEGAMPSGA